MTQRQRVADIYRTFERGQSPQATAIPTEEGSGVEWVVAPSQRNDVVVAERVDDTDATYNVIRIEPVSESRSEQMQRAVRTPGRPPSDRQFKHCKYQLKRTEIPELGNVDTVSPRGCGPLVHNACSWNRNTTRLRTAQSPAALQHAWDEWKLQSR